MKIQFLRFVAALSYLFAGLVGVVTLGYYIPSGLCVEAAKHLARARYYSGYS